MLQLRAESVKKDFYLYNICIIIGAWGKITYSLYTGNKVLSTLVPFETVSIYYTFKI